MKTVDWTTRNRRFVGEPCIHGVGTVDPYAGRTHLLVSETRFGHQIQFGVIGEYVVKAVAYEAGHREVGSAGISVLIK